VAPKVTDRLLHEVRCRTCRRLLGVSRRYRYNVFCNLFCATDYPVDHEEDRNAYVEYLYRRSTDNLPLTYFASEMALTRQRIFEIVKNRRIQG